MNFSLSFINNCIASVICISLPLVGLRDLIFLKILSGNIYLPITALLDGAFFIDGFSTTPSITQFLLFNFLIILYIPHLETFFF